MKLPAIKYVFSFGIILFGLFVPILPRVYMIYMRASNPERLSDVFGVLRFPTLYFITVFPFIVLSVVAWFGLGSKNLSEVPIVKRILGLVVAIIVIVVAFYNLRQPDFIPVIPYALFSGIMWLAFSHQGSSEAAINKRIAGIVVSFVAITYWGLAVSMPFVLGLGAYFFLICSPPLLLLTYFGGGSIGYWIVRQLFRKKVDIKQSVKNAEK